MPSAPNSLVFRNARQPQMLSGAALLGRIIIDTFALAAVVWILADRVLNLF